MPLSLLALWFVCALGSAVFAAVSPITHGRVIAAVLAFAAAATWTQLLFLPSPATVGLVVAAAAAAQVVRGAAPLAAFGLAGLLAGTWTGVLAAGGVPVAVAIILAPLVPAASTWLRRTHRTFAPSALIEEALLFLIVVGVGGAALPGISDGWHAAVSLSVQGGDGAAVEHAIPAWTLALASAALVSGGLFSLWSRR